MRTPVFSPATTSHVIKSLLRCLSQGKLRGNPARLWRRGKQMENDQAETLLDGSVNYDYNLLMSLMQVSVSKHLLDDYYTMVWSNDFYYKLIRYPKDEYEEKFKNRPDLYYQYHHYEDELEKIRNATIEAIKSGRSGYNVITRMPVKGGGHIWVRMNGIFTKDTFQGRQIWYWDSNATFRSTCCTRHRPQHSSRDWCQNPPDLSFCLSWTMWTTNRK